MRETGLIGGIDVIGEDDSGVGKIDWQGVLDGSDNFSIVLLLVTVHLATT